MALERKNRNIIPEQDANVRSTNFDEVTYGFDLETALDEASRCLNCKAAPCTKGCPVSVRIPEFIAALKDGEIKKAGEIIKSTNSLPSVCGRVCPQENQCEKLCVRNKVDGAVSIGGLERFVGDYMLGIESDKPSIKSIGKKVAVVGSGPAGLTCAAQLASNGVEVTLFEAFHKAGGVLVYGIPEFRLPKKLVQSEIDKLLELGVKLELNTIIGKTIMIDELREEFDAVFIGSGAGLPMFLNIDGENYRGVYSANEYLTRINLMGAYKADSDTPVQKGKQVIVIGAGNVAMDAARTAVRMGAEKVTVVYRRSRDEMPARREEIHHAEQEGVVFNLLTAPLEIIGKNGVATGMKCIKTELSEPDESGRRRPVDIAGSEYIIPTDMIIVALGTSPNPLIKDSYPDIEISKKGTLNVDDRGMTNIDNIYAGGDAVTGAATVILAMGAGRKAAGAILESFGIKA